jgi:nucleoid-associated protein YgaU
MKTIVAVILLGLTVSACGSKQEENLSRKDAPQQASPIQPVSFRAEPALSVEIVHPRGKVAELYSMESRSFEVRTSRPLKGDEYFWFGSSHPFVAYLKSYPEGKYPYFRRSMEKIEVTGGMAGSATFHVVVMQSTKTSTIIAETSVRVHVLSVPEKDSVRVRRGDTLYALSDTYLNSPEKWRELVRKNRFLGERGRVFKRSGKTVVIIRPGERLNGLARLGIKVSR